VRAPVAPRLDDVELAPASPALDAATEIDEALVEQLEAPGVRAQGVAAARATFAGTTFERVTFAGCLLAQSDFADALWRSVRLDGCDLTEADLRDLRIDGAELRGCTLAGLAGADRLRGAAMPWDDVLANAAMLAGALGIRVLDDDER
jgi:uncharacterized protein YjbI with pentapeptide repeats